MAATATPYNNGIKKPLNLIEGPIYPDIKKGPPRFRWSKKYWTIDPGAVIRDTEPFSQVLTDAILVQSRDYNKTVYGQSSHRDIVNAEFRPPLGNYYEDIGPLTRVPAKINPIIPRINPSTAGHDGTSGYTAKNERSDMVEKSITDRVKRGEWRPTFYAPIDVPMDNSILPDLEFKMPQISAHSGWNFPAINTQVQPEFDLGEEKLQAIPISSGFNPSFYMGEFNQFEDYETVYNRPQVSVTSGMNVPFQSSIETFVTGEALDYNRPQVSVTSGMNVPFQSFIETPVTELDYNRPQVSVTAGENNFFQSSIETPIVDLEEKLGMTPIYVNNPGSEYGYKENVELYNNPNKFIQDKRPSYSYSVPHQEPVFRSDNYKTHEPHFRRKFQAEKSYGKIEQSAGALPQVGVNMFREALKESFSGYGRKGGTSGKYGYEKKKVNYRF
jgi:hypothetical protein